MHKIKKEVEEMKNELYLDKLKRRLNSDENKNIIFEESQTGPQEEPVLNAYDVDVEKFKKYCKKHNIKY